MGSTPITNDCFDSRDGSITITTTGGSGNFFYDWYFKPQTSSVTLQLNNDNPNLVVDNVIPAAYFAGGEYYVKIFDGNNL